ncbi:MAG: ABC transporter substrate-binding protein [Phycisphaerales bacterium]
MAIALVLCFFATLSMAIARAEQPAKPVRIGVILASTGGADSIGKPERQILEALEKDWNASPVGGRRLELQFTDSGSDPKQAVTLFQQFAKSPEVLAVIGPSTSGESIQVAEASDKFEGDPPVLLSLAASREIVVRAGAAADQPRRWVFKFAQNDDLAATRIVREMASRGDTKIALLYSKDAFGTSGAKSMEAAVGGTVKLEQKVPFEANLSRPALIAGSLPAGLDAVLIWGTKPGPQLLLKELRSSGFKGRVYLSHGNASNDIIQATGADCEGAIVLGSRVLTLREYLDPVKPADKAVIDFREFWSKRFPSEPSHFAGHARDAFEVLRTVLNAKQTIDTRTKLRDAVENETKNFCGVTGAFTFSATDHAGLTENAFTTYVIRGGKFVPVENDR